jgi:hypothetical protein
MHTVQTGNRVLEFRHITSISNINQIEDDDYIFIVQAYDSLEIWTSKDKVRGSNELVHYYSAWYEREINEEDMVVVVLGKK